MTQSSELLSALTPMDYSGRADKVRAAFPEGIDALLVTHLTNVRYVTAYTGSNGIALITKDAMTFITDGRYRTQSKEELGAAGVTADILVSGPGQGPLSFLEQVITSGMRIGLEADTLSWGEANTYIDRFPDASFVPTHNVVENVRIIKEAGEVDRIRAACRIADDALAQCLPLLKEFPTEKEFAKALDRTMVDLGASGTSFDTIVACGTRGALPHAQPTDAKIEPNQMIVIDFGCMVEGYCSDMTRTVSVGQPDEKQQKMWDQVIESQKRGSNAVAPGAGVAEIDAQCRDYLAEQDVEKYFAHGTGHGVGLDIHEAPWVRAIGTEKVVPGNIITVEPGIYIEGIAGVRIEDTLCVTQNGAEVLTTAPKQLVIA